MGLSQALRTVGTHVMAGIRVMILVVVLVLATPLYWRERKKKRLTDDDH